MRCPERGPSVREPGRGWIYPYLPSTRSDPPHEPQSTKARERSDDRHLIAGLYYFHPFHGPFRVSLPGRKKAKLAVGGLLRPISSALCFAAERKGRRAARAPTAGSRVIPIFGRACCAPCRAQSRSARVPRLSDRRCGGWALVPHERDKISVFLAAAVGSQRLRRLKRRASLSLHICPAGLLPRRPVRAVSTASPMKPS